jgi:TP901 family phage tail tape measure protein
VSDTALIFNLLAIDRVTGVLSGVKANFGAFAASAAVAVAFAGEKALKMGADFETGMTRLVTGAGEAQSNMKLVSAGVLKMAADVGESTKDLSAGMYLVESAGFHGAAGLDVLRAAAMGAKVGNADMAVTADAVTTALNAYRQGADHAVAATNALIAAEGQGKTNLEALAGSLSTVAPVAAVAHVRLNEVLAAMSTMTAQGTPAAVAATYLRQTIGQLSNPTAKAAMEMRALGLTSIQVSQSLGNNGLAATLKLLTDHITAKMGPSRSPRRTSRRSWRTCRPPSRPTSPPWPPWSAVPRACRPRCS